MPKMKPPHTCVRYNLQRPDAAGEVEVLEADVDVLQASGWTLAGKLPKAAPKKKAEKTENKTSAPKHAALTTTEDEQE